MYNVKAQYLTKLENEFDLFKKVAVFILGFVLVVIAMLGYVIFVLVTRKKKKS